MRIVLVGGGTGGHFYPLIAIAEAIRDRDQALVKQTELYYIGPEEYDRESLAQLNIKYTFCPAGKVRRYFSPLNFFDSFKTFVGIVIACKKLYWLYPDVVMSKGGYTSIPVVLAAWFLKIPIVIHESDATPGRANKIGSHFARYIGISFANTADYFDNKKTALIGIPIRKIFNANNPRAKEILNVSSDKQIVFVTGGSSGAERINNLILDSLDELLPNYTLIHQAGEKHVDNVIKSAGSLIIDRNLLDRYFVFGHMTGEQFAAAQHSADIIISRAGSGTIAEISIMGKPSILIPIPEDISHDQRSNAYAYAKQGGAIVIEEKNLSDSLLTAQITEILTDKNLYNQMAASAKTFTQPDSAYRLADTLLGIASEHIS
jgi:UDP-N-acetylglucosamine--N-acetylmuramyl-(pentapeptide) pyrophosphoryl-undecaprenol N-acetylglucosamine transferase